MKTAIKVIILLILTACNHSGNTVTQADLFPAYQPGYATGFSIDSIAGHESTVITVRNPWQGADSVETRLLIARNGENVPEGFENQTVNAPVGRIVAMSSTHIAMLDAIGETGRIAGVSGIDFISNPEIRKRRNEIGDVGYDSNVNYERLIALEPDIVLLYGINGASAMEGKLRELGIPFMYVGDYVEESPLGKAEWMVALGELTDRRAEAAEIFSATADAYNSLSNYITGQGLEEPKVMLNTPYGDTWFMPPVQSYMATLISDASGEYIYKENSSGSTVPIEMEEAYRLASDAQKWINVSNASSLDELRRLYPKFADTRPVVNGEVYTNTLRTTPEGGNDFYESGIVHPDLILRDLIKIMHPELMTDKEFTYYRKLE